MNDIKVGGYGSSGCTCTITAIHLCPIHGDEPDFPNTGRGHGCNLCKEKEAALTEARSRLQQLEAREFEDDDVIARLRIEAAKQGADFDQLLANHDALSRHLLSANTELTALRARMRAMEGYVQHKATCPQSTTERWAGITHREQHLDDDAMETCHDPICRAFCVSANPPCTCGLTALLDLPVSETK